MKNPIDNPKWVRGIGYTIDLNEFDAHARSVDETSEEAMFLNPESRIGDADTVVENNARKRGLSHGT